MTKQRRATRKKQFIIQRLANPESVRFGKMSFTVTYERIGRRGLRM